MKLILLCFCLSSATAITNFHPQQHDLYPANYHQQNHFRQHGNVFQITKNPSYFNTNGRILYPNAHLMRLPQPVAVHNLRQFQNVVQNPKYLGFREYGPIQSAPWIPIPVTQATKPRKKKKSKSKRKNVPPRHYLPKFETTHYESSSTNGHEVPPEIPTKPIYPGEGKWAQPGLNHRPHLTKHKFKPLDDTVEPDTGHEIFDEAKRDFAKQQIKFHHDLRHFPQNHNLGNDDDDDYYEDTSTEEFIPYRTYSQVRQSETKRRLPSPPDEDERLKESIKNSKVHTVYTEEGYEDSGYDHADQEKNADSTEGYVSANKKNVTVKLHSEDVTTPEAPSSPLESELEENFGESKSEPQDLLGIDQKIATRFETVPYNASENAIQHEEDGKETLPFRIIVKNDDEVEETKPHSATVKEITPKANKEDEMIDNVNSETKFGLKIGDVETNARKKRASSNKYPYYNLDSVDENSPLRYSENVANIPKKRAGIMAFYNQADKVECDEVDDVDPVPERVSKVSENATKSEGGEELTSGPKLEKLGDKIDCFKAKYFGENPLDNPFFDEDVIEAPQTMFTVKTPTLRVHGEYTTNSAMNIRDYGKVKAKVSDIILGRFLRDEQNETASEDQPKTLPYTMKMRRKPYRVGLRRKYTPKRTTIYNSYTLPTTSKRISEVHYKDEIKPSEQLNVFADVINNIKNATRDSDAESSNVAPIYAEDTAAAANRSKRRKIPGRRYKMKTTTSLPIEISTKDIISSFYYTSSMRMPSVTRLDDQSVSSKIDWTKNYQRPPSSWTPMNNLQDIDSEDPSLLENESKQNLQYSNHRLEETTSNGVAEIASVYGLVPPRENFNPEPVRANNFYVIGMRPPPIKDAQSYARRNHVKKRRVTYPFRRRIVKRSTRRGYAEITRDSKTPEENPEDEEDYVPHRPKTYHYDVEKGRIVYDKTQEAKEEDQEYVDDVVEQVEEVTSRAKPKKDERILKFPDKPAEGPTYIDFLKQVKSHPSYHEIPDPTTTEKTTTTTTLPASTTEPEFLSILAKVRSDETYRAIADPSSTKRTTEIAEEEEEEVLRDVQNSPGGQVNGFADSDFQIFDISEYIPKVKNYIPATNIDTSKYKSIERVTITRHKYDTEEEENTAREGPTATTTSQTLSLEVPTSTSLPTSSIPKTERKEEVKQLVTRGRRRSTTTQSPTTKIEETSTRRTRGRGRSRFRSTTTNPEEEIRESTRNRRNLQRTHNVNTIPKNHKSYYSPIGPDGAIPIDDAVKRKVTQIATARPITSETLRTINVTNMPKTVRPKTNDDVDVFKNFDKNQRHGGNYKYKKVEISISRGGNYIPPTAYEIEDSEEFKRLTDVVPKPFAFYSDPILPSRINRLKEEPEFYEDTTDKPIFIKDPSKRLYYYAPV